MPKYKNQKVEKFNFLLEFISSFHDRQFEYDQAANFEKILNQKVHKNISYNFPAWPEWSHQRAGTLDQICGAMMKKFGYGNEKLWKDKLMKLS